MDTSLEENISFACEYCSQDLGPLEFLIENQIISNHECLMNFENVTVDYQSGTIRGENEIASSSSALFHLTTPTPEIWTDDAVKLLISIFKEHKDKFNSPSFTKKKVWEIMSQEFNKYGHNKSGPKLDEKWRNLKKTFDKVRTEKKQTGNAKVTWKFFEDFQDIYLKDPHFEPIATASTSDVCSKRKFESSDNSVEKESSCKKKNLCPGEKKKVKSLLSPAEIERRRQQRHEEKMNLKREIFEWFKENQRKN